MLAARVVPQRTPHQPPPSLTSTARGVNAENDVRSSNIAAGKAIAAAVRTSLGPRGMDKVGSVSVCVCVRARATPMHRARRVGAPPASAAPSASARSSLQYRPRRMQIVCASARCYVSPICA